MIKKNILLVVPAQNFNEEEYTTITNSLPKEQFNIFIASDSNSLCVGSKGMKVKNDIQLYNIHEKNFNGLILVGGSGMRDYWNNKTLQITAQKFAAGKKTIGAICSAPIILAKAGLLANGATCYTDDKKALEREGVAYIDSPVVAEKNFVTAQNPSSTSAFMKAFLYDLAK